MSGDTGNANTNDYGPLTVQQAENIADLAVSRAEERLYTKVGRTVVTKALYYGGAVAAAATAWLNDWLHIGPPK